MRILLIYHVAEHTSSLTVWNNNSKRYVNTSQLVGHLDLTIFGAFPALRAFTGSDYTSSFMSKGKVKVKALQLITKHEVFREAFANLDHDEVMSSEHVTFIDSFT